MQPEFFRTPTDFRRWLEKHHSTTAELLVGFYKKASGKPSMIWQESVEEALCFGWIDGIRRSVDAESYTIRFTPRRPTSTWSAINIRTARRLISERRMQPAGLAAFKARKHDKSGIYSYENRPQKLDPALEKVFRRNKRAWTFFESQPPSYRRTACFWVMSARKAETRLKRLAVLITDSESQLRIAPLRRTASLQKTRQR